MQERRYKNILYFIIAMISITLAIQGYWNYKNFKASKQQLINEVQSSLDGAVESYYADLAQDGIIGISLTEISSPDHIHIDSIPNIDAMQLRMDQLDSLASEYNSDIKIKVDATGNQKQIAVFAESGQSNIDTLIGKLNSTSKLREDIFKWDAKQDSTFTNAISKLTSKVIYGMKNSSLKLTLVDSLFKEDLSAKGITITHQMIQTKNDSVLKVTRDLGKKNRLITTKASSNYLPPNMNIELNYTNTALTILKRNLASFLISILFVIAIIACLLYLLKIIKNQKQLAEVKNDLISNITHEFKTPLATIGAAMEGIQLFNENNDPEKTQRYAAVSTTQVNKLNTMVEKLLETATLDSESLELNKEATDLVYLLETITTKEAVLASDKEVVFKTDTPEAIYAVDVFHFENALNNLIDNALKYGGDKIDVSISKNNQDITIMVKDSGNQLNIAQSKQIFEKFYRVPKGNKHDIKGFGIGLYYTKAIIEKHNATIAVSVKPTTFKIVLS